MTETKRYQGENSKYESLKKHLKVYRKFVAIYLKSRLTYKKDFFLGLTSQLINLTFTVAFLSLLFTQVESIQGWTFNEILMLAGVSGFILNLHHVFMFAPYKMGEDYIRKGLLDRYFLRPLNLLFHVFATYLADDNLSKLIANGFIIVYAAVQLGISPSLSLITYLLLATISGVMVIGSIFISIGTLAFWTGRSQSLFWLLFNVTDFRKYPYNIFSQPIQILLITLVPIAFASFFPATFVLGRDEWMVWQYLSIVAGPVFYLLAYRFWLFGVSRYSSTGS